MSKSPKKKSKDKIPHNKSEYKFIEDFNDDETAVIKIAEGIKIVCCKCKLFKKLLEKKKLSI